MSIAHVRHISVAFVVLVLENGIGRLSRALAFGAGNESFASNTEGRFFAKNGVRVIVQLLGNVSF